MATHDDIPDLFPRPKPGPGPAVEDDIPDLFPRDDPSTGRGFTGNFAAGANAAGANVVRGGTGLLNKIPSGLLDLLPFGTFMHPEDQPFSDPIVSDQTAEMVSQDAQAVQAQVGSSKVAKFTDGALGLAPAIVGGPAGLGAYAATDFGNKRLTALEGGASEASATMQGLFQGGVDIVAPGVGEAAAGAIAKKIGATIAGSAATGARRLLGAAAEHAVTGAATGEALQVGSAGVTAIGGDTKEAIREITDPTNAIIGGALGMVSGPIHSTLSLREAQRATLEQDLQRQAWEEGVARGNAAQAVIPPAIEPDGVASHIVGEIPAMLGRGDMTPPVEAFGAPDAEVQAQGAAELERMRQAQAAQQQLDQDVTEGQRQQQIADLRQRHAAELAQLGYPVEPQRDLLAERHAGEVARAEDLRAGAESRLQAVESEEGTVRSTRLPGEPSEVPVAPARPAEAPPTFSNPLTEARLRRGTEAAGEALPTVRMRRRAFNLDPQATAKIAALRESGVTAGEITQLIDHGQVDRAWADLRKGAAPAETQEAADTRLAAVESEEGSTRSTRVAGEPIPVEPAPPGIAKTVLDAQAKRAQLPVEPTRPSGAAPVSEAERPVAPAGEAPIEDLGRPAAAPEPDAGPDAPRASAQADATPLAVHRELRGPQAVLDPARRPGPEPEPITHEVDRETAINAVQPYKGNKRAAFTPVTAAVRSTFGEDARKVTTVHDPFGGGGGYGLSLALSEFPEAKKLVVGELNQGRLDKIRFIHDRGFELRKRAIETGAYASLRKVWEQMKVEGHKGSGGGVQGRISDRVIDSFYGPDGDGTKDAKARGVDPAEAKAIMYAYVDAMDRGVKGDFDSLVRGAEEAAYHGSVAAEAFRARGGEIEYRQGDAYSQQYEHGPHNVMVVDPPYVGTTGYGDSRSTRGDAGLYDKTATMLEQARARQNGSVYTDEAWWTKGSDEAPAVSKDEGQRNDRILDRAQAATDKWSFYPVAKRTESVAVTNGFRPGERRSRAYADEPRTVGDSAEPVRETPTATPGEAPRPGAKPAADAPDLSVRKPVGTIEQRISAEAEKSLARRREAAQRRVEAGTATKAQAEDAYQREHIAEVKRLRERLSPEDRAANDIERTTARLTAEKPADPEGTRRAALKKMVADNGWPGKVEDHPLGVKLSLPNGQSVVLADHGVPEETWDIKNWVASVMAGEGGQKRLMAATKAAFDKAMSPKQVEALSRKRQLELMRTMPPVAALLEGPGRSHGIDADHAVLLAKAIDKALSGGKTDALDEEKRQLIWRAAPAADKRLAMDEVKQFGGDGDINSAKTEEAAAEWILRRPTLKLRGTGSEPSILGRVFRAVRSLLSKVIPTLKRTPHIDEVNVNRVYDRMTKGDYLTSNPAPVDPTATGGEPRKAAATAGEPGIKAGRFSVDREQKFREGVRSEMDLPKHTDEEVQRDAEEKVRGLGSIEARRGEAERIASRAAADEAAPTDTEIAFLRKRVNEEEQTLGDTHSPQAAARLVEATTQLNQALRKNGQALRQGRYDLNTPEGRRDLARYTIFQLRGRDRTAYDAASKGLARARTRGDDAAAARHRETLARLSAKGQKLQEKMRAGILAKFGVDVNSPDLGRVLKSRYDVDNLVRAAAAEGGTKWSVGDIIDTTYRRNLLSSLLTLGRITTSNAFHYVFRTHLLGAMKGALGEIGVGDSSLEEYGQLLKATPAGMMAGMRNFRDAYFSGYDPKEFSAIGSKMGVGDDAQQATAPSVLQGLTGIDDSYVSTRLHSALDALFKGAAAHSFVAGEALRVAKAENRTGDAIGDRIHEILSNGPDNDDTGSWERAYTNALPTTFQDSYHPELSSHFSQNLLGIVNKLAGWREPFLGIRPLRFLLPFTGVPFSIARKGAALFPPAQAARMLLHWREGTYAREGGRDTLAHHVAEFAAGTGMIALSSLLVDKDDDKTLITGSPAPMGSAESNLQRRGGELPAYSIKLPFIGWTSYAGLEPFKTPMAAMVDWMRGKPVKQIANAALHDQFMARQIGDVLDVVHEMNGEDKSTYAARRMVASIAAGVTVPNLIRGGITFARDVSTGVKRPGITAQPEQGESTAELFGENALQAMTGGMYHTAPPSIDLYGREIPSGVTDTTGIISKLLGAPVDNRTAVPYDGMLNRWNQIVAEKGILNEKGHPAEYFPKNWPITIQIRGKSYVQSPKQVEEFSRLAGQEFVRRLDRAHLNLDNPTAKDIDRFKAIKEAVAAWAETRVAHNRKAVSP